ncbi:toxin [Salmonella enterica]|nr:toxin [Salmonella enterica]
MKYISWFIVLLSFSIVSCGSPEKGLLTHEEPFSAENGSLFSIRNVQSGSFIENQLDQFGRELANWQIVPQVTPASILATNPSGWVQIKDPESSQCLSAQGGESLGKVICNIRNKDTLFILIPSTTGAVQIKAFGSGKCLADKTTGSNFIFDNCVADVNRPFVPVPEKKLWMLNPPLTESSVAPVEM